MYCLAEVCVMSTGIVPFTVRMMQYCVCLYEYPRHFVCRDVIDKVITFTAAQSTAVYIIMIIIIIVIIAVVVIMAQ